ncbi:MAG: hypothetical protein METHSR3v1_2430013, partial [Methanothrix sp.]
MNSDRTLESQTIVLAFEMDQEVFP